MNKNNIVALVLLSALFAWYLKTNTDQQELMKAELEAKKATELVQEVVKEEEPESLPASEVIQDEIETVKAVVDSAVVDSTKDSVIIPQIQPKKVVVETENFFIEFDNKGAKISAIVLKSLADHDGKFPSLLEKPEEGALNFQLDKSDFSAELFALDTNLADTIQAGESTKLSFVWSKGKVKVERTFDLSNKSWKIDQKLNWSGINPRNYKLFLKAGLNETEEAAQGGFGMADYNFTEVLFKNGEGVNREIISEQKNFEEPELEWAGVRRKYLATVIDFGTETQAKILATPLKEDNGYKPTYALTISERLESDDLKFSYVILPLAYKQVEAYGRSYEEIIWSGWNFLGASTWFPAICKYALGLLKTFYAAIGNYGIAIILLTLLVKLVTMPLILSQQKNMKKMAAHKPMMDKLRKKHSGEPQVYQQELMAYYKANGINPLAQMFGCLPMFLQMPIFFSLFIVFSRAIELRNAPFVAWITDLSSPDILLPGIPLPFIMPAGLSLLPFIMAITTYFQTKQTMTDPNMKAMVYMMPIMMFTFSGVMPSGLVLYWIISNVFTIAQYKFIGNGKVDPNAPVLTTQD